MTRLLPLSLIAAAGPALAHPGHIATEAGHSHAVAVVAIAAAAMIAAAMIAAGAVARALVQRRRRRAAHG